MSFTSCAAVPLRGGAHVASFPTGSAFQIITLTAQSPTAAATGTTRTPRTARVLAWGPRNRSLHVGAGPATFVQVAQNFNAGWRAKLDGRTLTPVRLDGWEQGWVVPAGPAGTMTMTFAPDTFYRVGLGLGALLLVALLLLALFGRRHEDDEPTGRRPPLAGWVLALVAGVIGVVVGGWLALALVPLVFVAYRWGNAVIASVAGLAYVVAGIVVAAGPSTVPALHRGAFGAPAQIASVVALCSLLAAVVVEERRGYLPRSADPSDRSPTQPETDPGPPDPPASPESPDDRSTDDHGPDLDGHQAREEAVVT
jgi:arabinofuranan 3-O-arabinosyltransferase